MRKAAAIMIPLILLLAGLPISAGASVPLDDRKEMFYFVVPHPDDEFAGWSMAADHADDYLVFVTLTQGEGSIFCLPPEQSWNDREVGRELPPETDPESTTMVEGFQRLNFRSGPYGYQGPGTPVDEPDRGERHPLGSPWVGMRTEACKRARVASWHWFLDDMNALDGSGTSMGMVEDAVGRDPYVDDDYKGRMCPAGHSGNGDGRPVAKKIGCVDVWANEEGARVAFDLGNGHPDYSYDTQARQWKDPDGNLMGDKLPEAAFGVEEVTAALQTLREERGRWGIPVLPEVGMGVAADGPDQTCFADPHPDHRVVREALRFTDQGAGPQFGVSRCPHDPLIQGAETTTFPNNDATTVLANLINPATEQAMGPLQVNYGWLYGTYMFSRSSEFYWKVFD